MRQLLYFIVFIVFISGCNTKKDLGEITIGTDPSRKKQYKTHEQFIQIAYIDMFNKTIAPKRLMWTKNAFDSQGDDDINYRLFVKELINEAKDQLPSDSVVGEDPAKFIEQSYLKFLGRYPNGYELQLLTNDIKKDKSGVAGKIYYTLMTTEEYRMF